MAQSVPSSGSAVITGGAKESVSVKKLLAREGYWTCVKKVLGWILDTEAGTITLPERNLEELLTLVDIPAN